MNRVIKLFYIDLVIDLDLKSIETVCDGDYWRKNQRWGKQLRGDVVLVPTNG
jgi:hypothetical protein